MANAAENVHIVGRYALYQAIAAGGMATVHLGRLLGPVGFSRTVAIKRLHAQFAADPEFVSMFLDEARLAARIRHPNVVPTLDVVATAGELFLVMEYVPGESVARLSRALRSDNQTVPLPILSSVMAGALHGLHAAHEARDERGQPLGIVHRDVSPQNVLVGTDGVTRVLDFGVAKAAGRVQTTRDGQIKGKLAYMPPEQLRGGQVNRQTDVYAAGVMLWELVTGQRLFGGEHEAEIVTKVLAGEVERPSVVLMRSMSQTTTLGNIAMRALESLDATILRALAMDPASRFATAREMAVEIERTIPPATGSDVADWVEQVANDVLMVRAAVVAEMESSTSHYAVEPLEGHVQSVLGPASTVPATTRQPRSGFARSERPPDETLVSPAPSDEAPPATQPSSVAVATGAHATSSDARAERKRTFLAALAGVMLATTVLASVLVWRRTRSVEAAPPPREEPMAIITTPSPPRASATATEERPDGVAVADPETPPSGASSGTPGTKVRGGGAARTISSASRVAPPPSAAPDCSMPTWFDAQGVKHYKTQCL